MSDDLDPQPRTLEYATGVSPMNGYQRVSMFLLRVAGLLFIAYASIGILGLVGGIVVGFDVYPIGRHFFAIAEYGLLGVLAAVFAKPVGRWLGAAA